MTGSVPMKATSTVAAAMLACALGAVALAPQDAYAAEQTGAPLAAQSGDSLLAPQAAKKAIYVRASENKVKKLSYNKYGFITKVTDNNSEWVLKYSGAKLVKAMHVRDGGNTDITFTVKYDSKDRVKRLTVKSPMQVDLYNRTETYYYNKKGLATKRVEANAISGTKSTTKYSYNASGLLKKIVQANSTETLKYDSKGTVTKWVVKYPASMQRKDSVYNYTNTYKNGRLVKFVTKTGIGTGYTQTVEYKKVSIPKKYVAAVNAQQDEIRHTVPGSVISLIL